MLAVKKINSVEARVATLVVSKALAVFFFFFLHFTVSKPILLSIMLCLIKITLDVGTYWRRKLALILRE